MKVIAITPNKKQDYTTELVIEGLKELGVEIFATDVGNGITHAYTDDEILKIQNVDFVLAFFGKVRDNNPPKHYLLKKLKQKLPCAYVDGSEWTYTGYQNKNQLLESLSDPKKRRGEPWIHEDMLRLCDLYFKRECYPQDMQRGIIPLPFGLMKRHIIDVKEKDIDVFCVFGQHGTGLRKEVTEFCLKLKDASNYKIVVENSINPAEYKSLISRSRIVIDAWGGGDNCDRFYEAIGSSACCLYQKYNVIIDNPFVDYQHAVSYGDIDSFSNHLSVLLESTEASIQIGKNGLDHAIKWHTSFARAQKIVENIKGIKQ